MNRFISTFFCAAFCILPIVEKASAADAKATIRTEYIESSDPLRKNPDRGFFLQIGDEHREVSAAQLHKYWEVYRVYFSLADFETTTIDDDALSRLSEMLAKAKTLQISLIPRFYYTWGFEKGKPFRSPSEEMIRQHVVQLAPILNEYKDAISFVEAGFIGAWGEYHSDQYGSVNNYKPFRGKLVEHLLEHLDEDIFIALRYPSDRNKVADLAGLDERVGLHHDCPNYGNDTYPAQKADKVTKRLPQGGEVCDLKPRGQFGKSNDFEKYYGCAVMLDYFDRFNFDVLNQSDWAGSNSRFKRQGCFAGIERRLGYRFVLRWSEYKDGILTFAIENVGFGKSFKSRPVKIWNGKRLIETRLNAKNWHSGGLFVESVDIGETDAEVAEILIKGNVKLANETGNMIRLQ